MFGLFNSVLGFVKQWFLNPQNKVSQSTRQILGVELLAVLWFEKPREGPLPEID